MLVHAAFISKNTMGPFLKALFSQVGANAKVLKKLKVVFYHMPWAQVQELIKACAAVKTTVEEPFTMREGQGKQRVRYVVTVLHPSATSKTWKLKKTAASFGVDAASDLSITAAAMSDFRLVGVAEFLRRRIGPGTVVWSLNETSEFTALATALALGCRCTKLFTCVCARACIRCSFSFSSSVF